MKIWYQSYSFLGFDSSKVSVAAVQLISEVVTLKILADFQISPTNVLMSSGGTVFRGTLGMFNIENHMAEC